MNNSLNKLFKKFINELWEVNQYISDHEQFTQKILNKEKTIYSKFSMMEKSLASHPKQQVQIIVEKKEDSPIKLTKKQAKLLVEVFDNREKTVKNYPKLLNITSFVYVTSLFDAYLSDLLRNIFLKRSKSLISTKQLSYEEILNFTNIKSLKNYLIEKEIQDFSYKSVEKQFSYLNDKFNFKLDDKKLSLLIEIMATRNLHVHNRGIINQIYIDIVIGTKYKLNEEREISKDYLLDSIKQLIYIAREIKDSLS